MAASGKKSGVSVAHFHVQAASLRIPGVWPDEPKLSTAPMMTSSSQFTNWYIALPHLVLRRVHRMHTGTTAELYGLFRDRAGS